MDAKRCVLPESGKDAPWRYSLQQILSPLVRYPRGESLDTDVYFFNSYAHSPFSPAVPRRRCRQGDRVTAEAVNYGAWSRDNAARTTCALGSRGARARA